MIGTGAALIGSAILGAGAGLYGANKAANAQKNASNNALQFQQGVYSDTQNNLAPYREAGATALGKLNGIGTAGGWQDFIKSPDYQFRFNEGRNALEGSAAARGGLLSGNAMRGITDYGQGFAGNEFGNYWNRNFNTAQMGANAASGSGQLGANMSGQIGGTMQGIGAANASGIVGGTNAVTGAVGSGMQNYLLMQYLNKSAYGNPTGGGAPTGGGFPLSGGAVPYANSGNYFGAG